MTSDSLAKFNTHTLHSHICILFPICSLTSRITFWQLLSSACQFRPIYPNFSHHYKTPISILRTSIKLEYINTNGGNMFYILLLPTDSSHHKVLWVSFDAKLAWRCFYISSVKLPTLEYKTNPCLQCTGRCPNVVGYRQARGWLRTYKYFWREFFGYYLYQLTSFKCPT